MVRRLLEIFGRLAQATAPAIRAPFESAAASRDTSLNDHARLAPKRAGQNLIFLPGAGLVDLVHWITWTLFASRVLRPQQLFEDVDGLSISQLAPKVAILSHAEA